MLNSTIAANAGAARGRLRIEAVTVVGVPRGMQDVVPSVAVAPASGSASQDLAAVYDAAVGTLTIRGLDWDAGEPLHLSWSI